MRKFLSFLLAAIMVLSLLAMTACNQDDNSNSNNNDDEEEEEESSVFDGDTPLYKILENACTKTMKLSSMEINNKSDKKVEFSGETATKTDLVDMKISGLGTGKVNLSANGYSDLNGKKTDIILSVIDNMYYMTLDGEKLIFTAEQLSIMGGEDALDGMNTMDEEMKNVFIPLPKDVIEFADVESEGSSKTITASLKNDQFKELYKDYLDNSDIYSEEFFEDADIETDNFTEVKVKITINSKGYITAYSISYTLEIETEDIYGWGYGKEYVITGTDAYTIKNPGRRVEVTPPENAAEFLTVLEYYRKINWKEAGFGKFNYNVNSWDEFYSKNSISASYFTPINKMFTWEEFKNMVLEDMG